jgi:UDP-N-acetylmuramoyl-L-alanyl-D-glutamate--2,6-diaminopimelate ligase
MLNYLRSKISPQNSLLLLYHKILGILAGLIYGIPGRSLKVIGVTGTNGKTTTVNIIAQLFEKAGYKVGLSSGIKFKVGQKEWENTLKKTTLGRLKIQKILRQMASARCDVVIIEVTSHALVQSRLCGVKFDTAVLTNITEDHIEYHGSREAYIDAKKKLFANNPRLAVLPKADPVFENFNKLPAEKRLSYGFKNADLTAVNETYEPTSTVFELDYVNGKTKISLPLPGEHNIENALAAAAVALGWGISVDDVASSLAALEPIPGRYEPIDCGQDFSVIVDYAHAPDSLEKLCAFYKKSTNGRLIIVFGATGGGRDKYKRPHMGEVADKYCDIIIVTDDDPYTEDRQSIIDAVASGVKNKNEGTTLLKIMDRREAIGKAISLAQKDDTVLVAGKGCEKVIMLSDKPTPWSDAAVIRETIEVSS